MAMAENQTTLDKWKDKWRTKVLSAAIRGDYETVLRHIGFSELCDIEDRECVYTEAVHLAARGGHTATIKAFLRTGLSVDCASKDYRDYKGWTPLITAASRGHNRTVQTLISCGASVNLVSEGHNGTHALFQAANGNHLEVLTTLLQSGASVDQPSKYVKIADFSHEDWTPLIVSAARGHTRIVKKLLSHKADVNLVSEGRFGTHALFQAADENHVEVLSALLQAGANIDQVGIDRETPLMVAAINGHVESVQFLLDSGASIDYVEKREGWRDTGPAVVLAAWEGKLECVRLLLTSGANISGLVGFRALSMAAYDGHDKILDLLLENGAELNYDIPWTDTWYEDGTTKPLTAAAGQGQSKAVEVLLRHGSNPNERDNGSSFTVLLKAVDNGHPRVVDLLLKSGSFPNIIAPHTYAYCRKGICTALHLAADYKTVDLWDGSPVYEYEKAYSMIRMLLLAGANVKFGELIDSDPRVKVIKDGEEEDEDESEDDEDEKEVPGASVYQSNAERQWKYTIKEGEIQSALELMYEEAFSYDHGSAMGVHLLYAAGASIYEIDENYNRHTEDDQEVLDLIRGDQKPLLSLQGLCRRHLRAHLLKSTGGNHPNLVTAVPQLPIPKTMQKYMLFDVPNIFEDYRDPQVLGYEWEDMENEEDTEEVRDGDILNAVDGEMNKSGF